MSKQHVNISIRKETRTKLKKMKDIHGITWDELIKELLTKQLPRGVGVTSFIISLFCRDPQFIITKYMPKHRLRPLKDLEKDCEICNIPLKNVFGKTRYCGRCALKIYDMQNKRKWKKNN